MPVTMLTFHVIKDQSEVLFKTVTDANHAHKDNLLTKVDSDAISQDQHAHATRL
jgi:hypothetical protein